MSTVTTFVLTDRDDTGHGCHVRHLTGADPQIVAEAAWGRGVRVWAGRAYWGDPTCSRRDCLIGWIVRYR